MWEQFKKIITKKLQVLLKKSQLGTKLSQIEILILAKRNYKSKLEENVSRGIPITRVNSTHYMAR